MMGPPTTASAAPQTMVEIRGLGKSFTLHRQGAVRLPVFSDIDVSVLAGECVALTGVSGSGKSSLMRTIYGNYLATQGSIRVRHRGHWVDVVTAEPRDVMDLRRVTLGYVSQFLRVIPRVPTIDIVSDPLRARGVDDSEARRRAAEVLTRLNMPEALWSLPPATFSGGEQQRVNIARCFVQSFPILLLDEPTASLDPENRSVVIALAHEALAAGTAIIGIFHDVDVRHEIATREFDVSAYRAAA